MSTAMTRVRRVGLGFLVAAFSVGVVATSAGVSTSSASGSSHVMVAAHTWGN